MPHNAVPSEDISAVLPAPLLPLSRYRFRFLERPSDDGRSLAQASYLGSAWRGAFGRALRRAVCVTRLPACDSCMLLHSCIYPWLFESRTPPNARKMSLYPRTPGPFVLEPSDSGYDDGSRTINLGVILFGQANDQLPYVVHTFEQAGRGGLTSRQTKLDLMDIQIETLAQGNEPAKANASSAGEVGWRTIYEPGGQLVVSDIQPLITQASSSAVRVRLLTPLRIRRAGHLVDQHAFDLRSFVSVLMRRISLLTTFFGETPLETDFAGLLCRAESLPITQRKLHWREWTRYSSRQETKLQMGGLMGWFEVEGSNLAALWPYLWLGQWTHAGKGCSMGLGRYVLEPAAVSAEPAMDRGGNIEFDGTSQKLEAESSVTAGTEQACWASPLRL